MITRFTRIENHRLFSDFTWSEPLEPFARFNLIYGWNGSGKTTLSSLFRHLQDRRSVTEGRIQYEINGHVIDGAALGDGAPLPNVRVFNRDFIERTITAAVTDLEPIYFLGARCSHATRISATTAR